MRAGEAGEGGRGVSGTPGLLWSNVFLPNPLSVLRLVAPYWSLCALPSCEARPEMHTRGHVPPALHLTAFVGRLHLPSHGAGGTPARSKPCLHPQATALTAQLPSSDGL